MNDTLAYRDQRGWRSKYVWFIVAIFLLAVVFLGGSSRHDHVQVIALRPIAVLCLFAALAFFRKEHVEKFRTLLALLLILALWAFIQLVPLPPEFWAQLPGREPIANLDNEMIGALPWRPISLSPTTGWSSFAALAIPAAALFIAIAFQLSSRLLLGLVAILGIGNVLFGFLQMASGGADGLYLYRVTNRDGPTGLFANENHLGTFLAILILVLAKLAIDAAKSRRSPALLYGLGASIALTFLAILSNGSRAGVALGLLASFGVLLMFWTSTETKAQSTQARKGKGAQIQMKGFVFAAAAVSIIALLVMFLSLDRIPGLASAVDQDPKEELRAQLLAPLGEMIKAYWMLGIGFGSFAVTYTQFEPTEIAKPSYVNQAHNDWAQLIIEGGLPMIVLLAALVWLLARRIFVIAREGRQSWPTTIFWVLVFGILAAASAVDYPLRTAILQVSAIWLICALLLHQNEDKEPASRRRRSSRR